MNGYHFTTYKAKRNKYRLIRKDSDFCPYFEGVDPLFYEINVCTKCGFSFSDNFDAYIDKDRQKKFIETVSTRWNGIDYCQERDIVQAVETFKLALTSAQIVELKDSILAGLCLRISWLNRLQENHDEEKRFMSWAVELYKKAYEYEDFEDTNSISLELVIYLLGELNYRLENYNETYKWFNMALSQYGRNGKVSSSNESLVRDRWLEIKDQVKNHCKEL